MKTSMLFAIILCLFVLVSCEKSIKDVNSLSIDDLIPNNKVGSYEQKDVNFYYEGEEQIEGRGIEYENPNGDKIDIGIYKCKSIFECEKSILENLNEDKITYDIIDNEKIKKIVYEEPVFFRYFWSKGNYFFVVDHSPNEKDSKKFVKNIISRYK